MDTNGVVVKYTDIDHDGVAMQMQPSRRFCSREAAPERNSIMQMQPCRRTYLAF